MKNTHIITAAALCALLTGCADRSLDARRQTADSLAGAAHLQRQVLEAGPFDLAAWTRLGKPGAPARVYIEGDGRAWLSKSEVSPNPTPLDPVALRLAAADGADNVAYIARPCQYERWRGEGPCPEMYWTSGRTAPEVIAAYGEALDTLKAQGGITGFELVGYSGGAAVAALVAAERTDIVSLRTVAGNIDYAAFSALHGVDPLSKSIDPVAHAADLARLPQMHFIGAQDDVVPRDIYEAWRTASGPSTCLRAVTVEGSGHHEGWAAKWPELLAQPPACTE